MNHWPAPPASGPVHATVTVPGSKSMTNRALILAALAAVQSGPSRISGALRSRDTDLIYDFRNRVTTSTVNDGVRNYVTLSQYDNLDRVVLTASYHDSYGSGSPDANLIARSAANDPPLQEEQRSAGAGG